MSTVPVPPSNYDASPDDALTAVVAHGGLLFIDLDETLYLRNSTEDFIDLARPGLIARLLLRTLDTLRPWTLTGGLPTRDTWRVGLVWTLFPWTRARWRACVADLAHEFRNEPLAQALDHTPGQVVILTAGFLPIVEPLVAALGFPQARIVAARLSSFEDRRNGKLHAALTALGHEQVHASLVVTDSLDDLPLLARCARPLRTVWPGARFRRALERVYLPGDYITQIKRPGENYIVRVILQEDLVFWVLSSVFVSAAPWHHVTGLVFLLASFWAIYERGYVDNDWAAQHLEHDGKLSTSFWHSPVATPAVQPWIWSIVLGAIGVTMLRPPEARLASFLAWLAVLAGTYLSFMLYNRIDKSTRIWVYGALQLARSAALVAVVPVPTAGAIGLGALALSRWVPYYMYRMAGKWPEVHPGLIRLLFYLMLAAVFAVAAGPSSLLSWTGATLALWNLIRARSELLPMLRRARLLTRERPAAHERPTERPTERQTERHAGLHEPATRPRHPTS